MPPAQRRQQQQQREGGPKGSSTAVSTAGRAGRSNLDSRGLRDRRTQDDGVYGSGRRLERQSFAPKVSWEWQTGKDRLASSMYVCRPRAATGVEQTQTQRRARERQGAGSGSGLGR